MSEPRKTRLAVTVVSSNEKLLIPCLETLLQYRPPDCDFKVYAVWNAPGRGGPRLSPSLVARFPEVEITESFTSGFEFNQNGILDRISADYYLVINDDLIFLPGSVDKPLEYISRPENARVGQVTIRLLNADGSLQPSTYSFAGIIRTVLSVSNLRSLLPLTSKLYAVARLFHLDRGKSQYWSHDRTLEIETSRGAYMLVRDAALRQVGGFDLIGGAETEWHIRFHKHGWKIVFFHAAEVIHLGSMTVGRGRSADLVNLRSFLNIYYKHESRLRFQIIRAAFFVTYLCKLGVSALRAKPEDRALTRKGLATVVRWPEHEDSGRARAS